MAAELVERERTTILVVEDDREFATYLTEVLRRSGLDADAFADGAQARRRAERRRPALVLLDLEMAPIDGMSLLTIFHDDMDLPIVVVSSRGATPAVVSSLERGADDYLIKPVRADEMLARVGAVLRRSGASTSNTRALRSEVHDFGDLIVDVSARRVTLHGDRVGLTPKELDLLVHLARNRGCTVQRSQILAEVWHSTPTTSAASTVNELVRRLRRKLADDARDPRWIITEARHGYRLDPGPLQPDATAA